MLPAIGSSSGARSVSPAKTDNTTTSDAPPGETPDDVTHPEDDWHEFSDTQPPAPSGGTTMPDLSAQTLAATPEIAPGSDLGAISETETAVDPLTGVVEQAQAAGSPEEVDAVIAGNQETLDASYDSLQTATPEERDATLSQLSQLSELAGTEGQTALATGVVGQLDLENTNSEVDSGVITGLENAVFEGDGATLAVNVTSQLLERPELGATDLGTQLALHTADAFGTLQSNLETSTSEYQAAIDSGDPAAIQAADAKLFDASERYRSLEPGANAALASDSIGWMFSPALRDQAALAADPTSLQTADNLRSDTAAKLLAGTGLTTLGTIGVPPGTPLPKMADRHVLENANFFKASKDNSYLLSRPSDGELLNLYGEAYGKGTNGEVTLSNGQTWSIDRNTGKFFPVEGPGIVKLGAQEVRFLDTLTKQVKAGTAPEQALANLGRAIEGQGYAPRPEFQSALETLGGKLGYSPEQAGKALAPFLPEAAVPAEATAAAAAFTDGAPFRFVKWGGRLLLVVGVAADAYQVYTAENKPRALVTKAGAWGGSIAAGSAAAEAASPLLAGGPWGWAGYGLIVLGAGAGGYFAGEKAAETLYDWTFE